MSSDESTGSPGKLIKYLHCQLKQKEEECKELKNKCQVLENENAQLKSMIPCSSSHSAKSNPIQSQRMQGAVQNLQANGAFDSIAAVSSKPYEFVGKAVKGRKRKELPGETCNRCLPVFNALGLASDDIQACSRHRSSYLKSKSPPGFWNTSMINSQEILAKQLAPWSSPERDFNGNLIGSVRKAEGTSNNLL